MEIRKNGPRQHLVVIVLGQSIGGGNVLINRWEGMDLSVEGTDR